MWQVYILECNDGTYYTGITKDIPARLECHNSGNGAKYTRSRRPCRLVYFENHKSESAARKREYEIKQFTHIMKEELVLAFPPAKLENFSSTLH